MTATTDTTSQIDVAAAKITAISEWIDNSPNYAGLDREAHDWRRIQKVAQETGEVFEAFCGCLGENPRKGVTHTQADVKRELFDVALAALGAVEHLNGNKGCTLELFLQHIDRVCARALGGPR